ncbi:MAG: hypothetical protein JSW41_00430 [Candidatus Aenigmatarchaeota archaeon]|nr:MAG: hypothetical protein JSW41_00430 [Candidatus Aenigmarchaeota archaeon]
MKRLSVLLVLLFAIPFSFNASADDESLISIEIEDDWYVRDEIVKYNISGPPGRRIHMLVTSGLAVFEYSEVTDVNGTWEGAFPTSSMKPGAWTIYINDEYNNTAEVKFLLKMNDQDLWNLMLAIEENFRFMLRTVITMAISFITAIAFIVLVYSIMSSKRRAEITGEKTFWDSTITYITDRFKFGWERVGTSKAGRRDSLMVARKKFNELYRLIFDNVEEIDDCDAWIENVDRFAEKYNWSEAGKKRRLERWNTTIRKLTVENQHLAPLKEEAKEEYIEALARKGLWHPHMSYEDEQRLLYGGEDWDSVRPFGGTIKTESG